MIGFGGRVIGQGEPKYLNSPETPLFEKGRELYGLYQARRAIRDANQVIVVEGYMDVVALAQHGVENAVATLGTATTPMHVAKLLKMADNVVFCFDGDAAGRKAAWRALEVSLPVLADGKLVSFLFLPPEDDPDTYVRRLGKEGFDKALAQAKPLSQFLFAELASHVDMATEEGRASFVAHAGRCSRRSRRRAGRDASQAPRRARAPVPRGGRSTGARQGPGAARQRARAPARLRKGPARPESRILAIVLHRTELAAPGARRRARRARGPRRPRPARWSGCSIAIPALNLGQVSAYFDGSEHAAGSSKKP